MSKSGKRSKNSTSSPTPKAQQVDEKINTDSLEVYQLYYRSPRRDVDAHVALFIALARNGRILKGNIFDVQGPYPKGRQRMSYKHVVVRSKTPENSSSFMYMNKLGHIRGQDIPQFEAVCRSVTPPNMPSTYRAERPDCADWIDNVLFRLSRARLISFLPDAEIPSNEVPMEVADGVDS